MPPGWHGYRPTGTWKTLQGKGQGIRQIQQQKRSKGRLASLFPHRCCWTQKQGWTESSPIYKTLGFHLLRPSTSNSGRAWDNLSSCRSHQGLPRGDFYKAPHISYLIQVTWQKSFSERSGDSQSVDDNLYCWRVEQVRLWLQGWRSQGSLQPT